MLGFLLSYQPGSETEVGQLLRGMSDALQGKGLHSVFQHGMVLALMGEGQATSACSEGHILRDPYEFILTSLSDFQIFQSEPLP